ncbi:MAG: hypothetical protein DYH12_32625 [Sorangiineae bacterium PRO1]|nr:hypothetical protein [Sorangiineae bacterium PRO1]
MTFDVMSTLDRHPWTVSQCREVLVGESVSVTGHDVQLDGNPLEVVTEPEPGAVQIDGSAFTATMPGFYSLRCRSAEGSPRRVCFVAWQPEALDFIEAVERKNVNPGRERSREQLRLILRSLSNHDRDKLTGRVSDLHVRNLAHHGART